MGVVPGFIFEAAANDADGDEHYDDEQDSPNRGLQYIGPGSEEVYELRDQADVVGQTKADGEKEGVRQDERERKVAVPLMKPGEALEAENVFEYGETAEQHELPQDRVRANEAGEVTNGNINRQRGGGGAVTAGVPPVIENEPDAGGVEHIPEPAPVGVMLHSLFEQRLHFFGKGVVAVAAGELLAVEVNGGRGVDAERVAVGHVLFNGLLDLV